MVAEVSFDGRMPKFTASSRRSTVGPSSIRTLCSNRRKERRTSDPRQGSRRRSRSRTAGFSKATFTIIKSCAWPRPRQSKCMSYRAQRPPTGVGEIFTPPIAPAPVPISDALASSYPVVHVHRTVMLREALRPLGNRASRLPNDNVQVLQAKADALATW
jgi:hypothetical protein